MSTKGSYDAFRTALLAFESGWDRVRYDAGIITDAQLDQWARGPVEQFYPQYDKWSELNNQEWETMSYRSMNTLGFVGYQFGEALLIDLGYYDDDVFYGAGAATNTWDGTWTGKNGVTSLRDFTTKEAQEIAIREAFGHNLKIIQDGLSNKGENLDDYIGTTRSYVQNGETVEVTLTMTGIMAAAHLRGAYGTLALLQGGNVSTDEFGTSILRYIEQFGGYDAPTTQEAIAYYTDRLTGDEGLGIPGETPSGGNTNTPNGSDNYGDADTSKEDADVVITWNWGQNILVTNFNPENDRIFIDWIGADAIDVREENGNTVFSVPSNNQSITLQGIGLTDLSSKNFTILDKTAADEILDLIKKDTGTPGNGDNGNGDTTPPTDNTNGDHTHHPAQMVMIGLESESRIIADFAPNKDMLHILEGVTGDRFEISELTGQGVQIVILTPGGDVSSTTVLQNITLQDLKISNFSVAEQTTFNEVVTAINAVISTPGEPVDIIPDTDGSHPPVILGRSELGGRRFEVNAFADDIVGFNPDKDTLDFVNLSVHGMIVTKTPDGQVALDNPWNHDLQILQGISFQNLDVKNFGIVGNEHLRQDIGGVLSWEKGLGPREANTVYIRSHEYGANQIINDFDPDTMKISFLYYGTRERLSVQDTKDGLVIKTLPSGQAFTFTDVKLAELAPGRVEFHFDQVHEDNLETPFGFRQEDVTLVDRTVLLTPQAPTGETTDGFQTREGIMTPPAPNPDTNIPNPDEPDISEPDNTPRNGTANVTKEAADIVITWQWGQRENIEDFDPATDTIFIDWIGVEDLTVEQAGNDTVFSLPLNNQSVTLKGVSLVDLSEKNFTILDNDTAKEVLQTIKAAPTNEQENEQANEQAIPEDHNPQDTTAASQPPEPTPSSLTEPDNEGDQIEIGWKWGAKELISDFNPATDTIDFGNMSLSHLDILEDGDDLVINVQGNGGQSYRLEGIQAEDLTANNLEAAPYNTIITSSNGIIDQLTSLGFDDSIT
ncbi:hypothetical protein WH96_05710 [Kiloniella spongiae]|uniref:Uncharacterized protein n=1 Tax=Kiloniella spongiae TaxID=1489064 RepID=A0A0H2MHA6_9PROT|nr:hypothetical protein [Kiloniella spongiae]KLN61788.1 hypothetical protein WH96_05710 [Kiloniella spongiae]